MSVLLILQYVLFACLVYLQVKAVHPASHKYVMFPTVKFVFLSTPKSPFVFYAKKAIF